MNVQAKTIPSANSTGAPYVAGNFAPLRSEVTAFDLEVVGRVPEELTGRFLRIGPNPIDELDLVRLVRYHWFAGTGMAHGLRLHRGKAEWFRSRFVLDRDAARVLSRKPIPGPSVGKRDGNVNTNLMNVGGKLCAVRRGRQYSRRAGLRAHQHPADRFRRHARGGLHRPPEFRPGHGRAARVGVRSIPAGPLHLGRP